MVLLVDDNEYSSQLMVDYFEYNGLKLQIENNPELALKRINEFSVVITDMNMREMTGLDLVRKSAEFDTLFIVISGYLCPDDINHLTKIKNVYSIRNKSDSIEIILHTVKKALEFAQLKNKV